MLDPEQYPLLTNPWMIVFGGTLLGAAVLLVARLWIIRRLRKLTDRTRFTIDSLLVKSVSLPLTLLTYSGVVLLGQWLILETELFTPRTVQHAGPIARILAIAAFIIFIERLVSGFIHGYSAKSQAVNNSKSIIQGLSRGFIIVIGSLVLLGTMAFPSPRSLLRWESPR